jgi:outer membrane protein OmpA-like peptidoglycan-associated protein
MNNRPALILITAGAVLLGGCTQPDDPNQRAKTGAAIGAIAGAVLGHQMDGSSGKWVGAAVGALAGAGVGHYMDNQQQAFEQSLADEQAANQLEIERLKDDTLKLTVDSEVSFDFNRAEIKPAFLGSLDKLAAVIMKYDRTVVHVVGHTDSVGSDAYNQELSERRARSVGDYLASRGVPDTRLRTEGRGEREPRATNATEAGRQLNRRVEIFVKPVVEGQEQRAYEPPRYY